MSNQTHFATGQSFPLLPRRDLAIAHSSPHTVSTPRQCPLLIRRGVEGFTPRYVRLTSSRLGLSSVQGVPRSSDLGRGSLRRIFTTIELYQHVVLFRPNCWTCQSVPCNATSSAERSGLRWSSRAGRSSGPTASETTNDFLFLFVLVTEEAPTAQTISSQELCPVRRNGAGVHTCFLVGEDRDALACLGVP